MQKESNGDVIASTLDYYRERINSNTDGTPENYRRIQRRLEGIRDKGLRVLMDIKDSYSVQTVIVNLEYISERWAMGTSTCYTSEGPVEVPYTIHYSDIVCKKLNIKVIVEGDSPYGKKCG